MALAGSVVPAPGAWAAAAGPLAGGAARPGSSNALGTTNG